MRIVAGTFRSRGIKAVDGDSTRPTTDKVKEAIFSRIGPYFDGGVMLDLFGGSGNMGLEALSRGMDTIYFSDVSHKAIATIKENIRTLGVESHCIVRKTDFMQMLSMCAKDGVQFDLIYLDPPYKKQQIAKILQYIEEQNLLKESGDIICESLKEDDFADTYGSLYKVKDTTYGITRITYYTR